ncbi:hypothetical protein HanXRQr2_Chr07g0312661 [Helianthus annuus]|uniref:Uncharacterized protein n=1 Tax=Helianthus annuus TaxID=4232 RepID=A0A9K3INQ6_HELAN|nr:hypothetical protein HanXRQr2_Chr07g0312661 [Helianthus annuus]KAJ0551505.1 hypothetical protein HanHA300_Chr07g0257871 [Helianthus annuus]KAJ0564473.1 hypothetical protein HanHA89_Chr07g0274681 [Helianthus annuus]KAJ0729794.1 hypothetical protein HanLR1_Chr07g0256921 [Helianthus annuus]KAJ0732531.1 hypothetical protein HanOQP8_Chr07g0264231 [Helianthus annuus]
MKIFPGLRRSIMHALYNGEHQSEDKKEKGAKTLYALGNRSNKHLVAWEEFEAPDVG